MSNIDFDSAPDESEQQQAPDQSAQPAQQSQPIDFASAPDESADSSLVSGVKSFARTAIPNTLGAIAGVAAGAGLMETGAGALAAVPAGFAVGGGVAYGAQKVQDALTNAMGITDPDQTAADATNHPIATTVGELATAPITFGVDAGAAISKRLLSGAIVGGMNLVQQGIEKGPSNISPTEALVAAGVGAALPGTTQIGKLGELSGMNAARAARGEPAMSMADMIKGQVTPVDPNAPKDTMAGTPAQEAVTPVEIKPERPIAPDVDTTLNTQLGNEPAPAPAPPPDEGNIGLGDQSSTMLDTSPEAPQQGAEPYTGPDRRVLASEARAGEERRQGITPKAAQGQTDEPLTPAEEAAPERAAAPQQPVPEQVSTPAPKIDPQSGKNPAASLPGEDVPSFLRRAPDGSVPKSPLAQEELPLQGGAGGEAPKYMSEADVLGPAAPKRGDDGTRTFPTSDISLPKNQTAPAPTEYKPGEITDAMNKPRPLSAGAPGENELGYGPNAPRAAVKAMNGGLWQRANDTLDKLFSLPRWLFAPHTISDEGMQADRIISKNMGEGKAELANYQNALQDMDTYFHKMSAADRTSAVTEYENGQIPPDHPGGTWMKQARATSDKLDSALTAANGTDTYARQALPSFFEDGSRVKLRENMDDFKQRNNRYPTLGEAMKMGFKLKDDLVNADGSPNPQKVVNQQNFMKSNVLELKKTMNDASEGWKAEPGMAAADPILHQAPGEGLVKLDPALTDGATKYAAPEVKAVLERYFNPTLRDGEIKNAYESYMKLKNASNSVALATGIYHLRFMFQEAPINEFNMGFSRIFANPGEAIKDIIKAPLAPYTLFKQGKNNVLDAILHPESVKDPMDKVVNATLKEAGALPPVRVRGMGVTPELETGAVKGLATAWKPAFQEYMRDQVQAGLKIKNKISAGDLAGAGKDTSIATLRAFTEGMQLMMHPLLNSYIPLLKAGANFSNMKRFYIDNPGLTHDQYVEMGRKFVRATDNSMGELNQSNLYAPAWIKAIGNGSMVSLGWNVGDVKQFLGGARAFVRNPKAALTGADFDPRIMYMPAFVATTALSNIAIQLLHGQGPPKDATDVAFPRSGGTTKAGNPERIIQPGYEKDIAEWANIAGGPEHMGQNFGKMMYNKLAPFPKSALDMFLFNKNFANKAIVNPNDPFAKRLKDYWEYFERHALTPIAVQSATSDPNPDSKISATEHVLGNRHAPQQWQDPKEYAARIKKQNESDARAAQKFKDAGYH